MKQIASFLFTILCFAILVLLLLMGFDSTAQSSQQQDEKRVKLAVEKAALTCYSIEGSYAKDIAYLKQHYGLRVDDTRYTIHYDWIGDNLKPDIRLYVKGGDAK